MAGDNMLRAHCCVSTERAAFQHRIADARIALATSRRARARGRRSLPMTRKQRAIAQTAYQCFCCITRTRDVALRMYALAAQICAAAHITSPASAPQSCAPRCALCLACARNRCDGPRVPLNHAFMRRTIGTSDVTSTGSILTSGMSAKSIIKHQRQPESLSGVKNIRLLR